VGADPPHRVSRTSARLEEPPKPSQSLSVAVATKAPVRAFPLRAPSAGSARREARGAFTLEARAAGTRPWFRGTHPRLGHPSIVSAVARSRPLDFPSPRARTPPDAIPTEACACGLDRRASPLIERHRDGPRTPFTRAPRRRLVWPRRFLRARSRVSLMRYSRKGASRPKMRPIDFCTPKPFPLEHPYVVASQRSHRDPRAAPFGAASSIGHSRPGAGFYARSVLDHANVRFRVSRAAPFVRRRAAQAPSGSGPSGANETGENRVSRRGSHFGARSIAARALSSLVFESMPLASDTPVASSVLVSVGRHAVARRPPRSVPRGPRERRAHSRPRVPSIGSRRAHPARAEARTKPRDHLPRSGAHVMRIAAR